IRHRHLCGHLVAEGTGRLDRPRPHHGWHGFGANAHRCRHGNANGRVFRAERRRGVGALAGAASHPEVLARLSSLWSRRLRRRKAQRVPRSHRDRCSVRRGAIHARGNGVSAPRIAIVRQKYDPSGGAERFVARAIDALQKSGDANIALLARTWGKTSNFNLVKISPFYLGRTWRDWGFARAV